MPRPAGLNTSGFGRLLREWRRQRGLSQLDLALGAGTTPRHVSFLETGRSRPRSDIILRLAAELDLPRREQNALLQAAGLRAAFPDRGFEDRDLAPFRMAIDSLLTSHEPLPAAVVDRYGTIRQANAAFERMSPGLVGREPEELVELFFGPGPYRSALVNWTELAAAWLVRQRHEVRRTGDPRLEALVARAEHLIGPLPHSSSTQAPPTLCSRIMVGDRVLELFVAVVKFDMAQDVSLSELRIELMYPADDATRRFFQLQVARAQDD